MGDPGVDQMGVSLTIHVGEVIATALGPVVVVRLDRFGNYMEAHVRCWTPEKHDGAERVLTGVPGQGLRVAAPDSAEARGWATGEPEAKPVPVKTPGRRSRSKRKAA